MREYRDIFDLAFDTDPASVTGQAGVVNERFQPVLCSEIRPVSAK